MLKLVYLLDPLLSQHIQAPYQVQRQLIEAFIQRRCLPIEITGVVRRKNLQSIPNAWRRKINIVCIDDLRRLKQVISAADLIHLIGLSWKVSLLSFFTNKVITTIHGDATFCLEPQYFTKKTIRQSDLVKFFDKLGLFFNLRGVSVVSRSSHDVITSNLVLNKKNPDVIYNGVANEFFVERLQKRDTTKYYKNFGAYLCIVNNKAPKKNIETALKVFDYLLNENLYDGKLLIAGMGYSSEDQEILCLNPKARERIKFLGNIGAQDLRDLYYGSDALLNPTLHETFGLPNVEAILSGAKVVTSDTYAIKEVTMGHAYYLEDPISVPKVARDLLRALSTDHHNNKGSIIDLERYNWKQVSQRYLDWYQGCLNG